MKKVILKTTLKTQPSNATYWLTKTAAERLAAVEFLRRQVHGDYDQRVQRVFKITKLKDQ